MTSSHHRHAAVAATLSLLLTTPAVALSAPVVAAAAATSTSTSVAPNDVVGRSSSSNVLRVDDLAISTISSSGATSAHWSTPSADLSSESSRGQDHPTTSRRALSFPTIVSRSARLLDPQSDRVLSLQRVAMGDGASWQLASPSGAMENASWSDKNVSRTTDIAAGQTYAFQQAYASNGLSAATDSGDAHDQLQVEPVDATAMAQQWSLRAAADGSFRLVDRSDGMCLNVLDGKTDQGSPVGAWPCPDPTASDNEEWVIERVGRLSDNTFRLNNVRSGRNLVVDDQGHLALGLSGNSTAKAETWTLTGIYDPVAPVPTWSTPASASAGLPAAMATGDLDRSVGANGQYGDEAAVAYVDDDHQLQVRVIDYNATADHFLASAPTTALPDVGTTIGGTWYAGSVGVAIGNFTGQVQETVADPDHPGVSTTQLVRDNQVAVTWQNDQGFHATFLTYTPTAGGGRTLSVAKSDVALPRSSSSVSSKPTVNALAGMAETAVGDFNGDDVDDLAIGYGAADGVDASTGAYAGTTAWLKMVNFTSGLAVSTDADQQFDGRALLQPAAGSTYSRRGVSLSPGLFDLDAASSDIRERHVAASWTDSEKDVRVQQAGLSSSGTVHLYGDTNAGMRVGDGSIDHPVSLAAGGFSGLGSGTSFPAWGLALAVDSCLVLMAPQTSGDFQSSLDCNYAPDVSVAAYDRTGRSLLLGAPAVLTVDQIIKPFLIASQPPTHADWLTDPTTGEGRFVNVSRNGEFTVDMGSGTDSTTTSTHTTKSATSLGISEDFDSKTTVKGGLGSLESVSETVDVGQKFDKESEKDTDNTTKYTHSTSIETSQTTAGDDVVNAVTESDTVYRYPILNGPLTDSNGNKVTSQKWCPTTCYGFYEVTVPGKAQPTEGNGKANIWYQPDWQNGNALSYPPLVGGDLELSDQGSYSYPDPTNGGKPTVVDSDIADTPRFELGGTALTETMKIQDGASSDTTRSASGSLTNSQEVKSTTKVHGTIGAASASEDVDISAGVQEGSTWADTKTSTNDVTASSDFKVDVPEINADQAYDVLTKYYVDKAGTPKVVHGVDLTSNTSGAGWWRTNYSKPDLALNLNDAVTMTYNDKEIRNLPKWTPDATRQLIRGFSALQPDDPDSPVTSGQPYVNNPTAGDAVTFAVRLHNYSLSQAPGSTAQFYAVPMQADDMTIAGSPVAIGGTVTTPALGAQGVTTITSNPWTAVGPSDGTGNQMWRIFVVLDPDGTVDETHPWKGGPACPESSIDQIEGYDITALTDPMTGQPETLACGQNNQGYGEVTVTAQAGQQPAASTRRAPAGSPKGAAQPGPVQPSLAGQEDEDYLVLDKTTLFDSRNLPLRARHKVQQAVVEESVHGVVHASSAIHSGELQNVLVWDGAPGKGEFVAHAQMAGADADTGGTAGFTWRPSKPGRHVLTTVLLTTHGPDKVHRTVVDVKAHGKATGLSLSPGQVTTHPRGSVRFTTSTVDAHGNRIKDVTRSTRLTIGPDGSCRKARCSAMSLGDHIVTAHHAGRTATATLTVSTGGPAVTPTRGTGQQVATRHAFKHLVAEVTGADGKPVDRAHVRFSVTSGDASFAGGREAVTVRTGPDGTVRAPRLTAGRAGGPVVVSAVSGDARTVYALAVRTPGRDRADLAIGVSGATSAKAGATVTTTVRVTNRGPRTARGTLVEVVAPPGATLGRSPHGTQGGSTVLYRLAPLRSGASRRLKLEWTGAPGSALLRADAVSSTTDRKDTNNHATQTVSITS